MNATVSDVNVFPDLETLSRQEAWLRPVVRALVADDAASDVLQETWLRAWRRPPRDPARSEGWLRRVAVRLASTHRRAESRRRRREGEVAAAASVTTPSTTETIERLALQRAVSVAVSELAEPYRTTVLLRFYHGLSVDEVAAKTATTAANVRQRTHRGLESMRTKLERELGSGWRRAPVVAAFLRGKWMPATSALPLVLSMTKLRFVIAVLCLLAVGAVLVPWFLGDSVVVPSDSTAPVGAPLAAAPKATVPLADPSAAASPPQRSEVRSPAPAPAPARGVVLDERGQPAPNVGVGTRGEADGWCEIGTSDATGHFDLARVLPLDAHQIEVVPPWTPLAVQLPAPRETDVPLMVVVARSREQVLLVRDETGMPIGEARATVRVNGLVDFPRPLDDAVEFQFDDTVGDAVGRHHWERVPLAATSIHVSKPGYRPTTVGVDASTPTELQVVLSRISKGQRLLTGTVTDARGGYVRGATVGLGGRETTTDAFGSYALLLEPGAYVHDESALFAVAAGWYPAIVVDFGRRVRALPEGTLTQDLLLDHRALTIRGRVVDHEGRPQAGVVVYPWQLENLTERLTAEDLAAGRSREPLSLIGNLVHAFARTDTDGAFAVPGLDRRPYRLRVYDAAEPWAWTSPEIDGGSENVELRLPADVTGPVAGIVRDRAGRPAVGVDVAPYLEVHANGGGVASVGIGKLAKTDAEGRFSFAKIARHAASLKFGGTEWVQCDAPLDGTVPAGDLRIVVMRRCHVRVQLADPAFATARIAFVDAAGTTQMIQEDRGSTSMSTTTCTLHDGKSKVLSVSEAAATLVVTLLAEDATEQRFPISLVPGEVNLIAR